MLWNSAKAYPCQYLRWGSTRD